jgi:predicted DNA-binding transcriptional regulator AlpA
MASSDAPRLSPVLKAAEALVRLSVQGKGKEKSPVIHVLTADGRTTEFARRAIVLPESGPDEASQQVYALLINGNGEVFVQPDGQPAVVDVPAVTIRVEEDGSKMLSLDQVAARTGMSLATLRRRIADGSMPQPTQVSKRRVGLPVAAVRAWLNARDARDALRQPIRKGHPAFE